MPRCSAFCRRAPTVRFIALEIFTTGVFARECPLSSLSCSFVHSRGVPLPFGFAARFVLAMLIRSFCTLPCSTNIVARKQGGHPLIHMNEYKHRSHNCFSSLPWGSGFDRRLRIPHSL